MLDALLRDSTLAAAGALVVGLMVGSFLNVVIHRLPRMMARQWALDAAEQRGEAPPAQDTYNLAVPRSACPHCGHQLRAWENIPVFSWLLLRGRCSNCAHPISIRYPLVEVLTAVLSAAAVAHFGATWTGLGAVALTWALIALTFIDFDTQLLPDSITLPLLWAGLLLNLGTVFVPVDEAVIGAAAGYGSLWSIYWLFKLATGKEGMGYGDFKLLAALGAWFGWKALPAIVLASSVVGAVVGIGLIILARRGREVPIPFGPYLAGAGLLMLYFRAPLQALTLGGI
jgi:leader peptidase (prepilin peptidase) / N-methyltransferase